MRKFVALFLSLVITTVSAQASQGRDFQKLNDLFLKAEIHGPTLIKCGRDADKERMFNSISFLEEAYTKLNGDFPRYEPPLSEQLEERFEIVCKTIECQKRDPTSVHVSQCKRKTKAGKDSIMEPFDAAVTDAQKRLKKAGLSASSDTTVSSSGSCPKSAQYYQDAYITGSRISDLECYRKALERIFR